MTTKFSTSTVACGPGTSISQVVNMLDRSGQQVAWIVDNNGQLVGQISLPQIRSSILNEGTQVNDPINTIMDTNVTAGKTSMTFMDLQSMGKAAGLSQMPVLDPTGKLVDVLSTAGSTMHQVNAKKFANVNRVLVTGAAGYIGSILVRLLLEKGYEVRVLDKLAYGANALSAYTNHPNFTLVKGDLAKVEDIIPAIDGVDAVVHLAGIVGDPACGLEPKTTLRYNLHSTMNLAHICKYHQINRFVFASSCSVYGTGDEILNEQSPLKPVSLYAQDKINCERSLLKIMDDNFAPTFMRMGTIHGLSPRPRFDLVVNILTAFGTKENKFTIFGGDQWRPFVHVEDAARSYVHVLEAPVDVVKGQAFNVGSNGENYKIIDVGHAVKEIIPSAEMIISTQQTDIRNYRVNFDKITNALGFKAEKTIVDGVHEIRNYLLNNPDFNFKDLRYNNFKSFKAYYEGQSTDQENLVAVKPL